MAGVWSTVIGICVTETLLTLCVCLSVYCVVSTNNIRVTDRNDTSGEQNNLSVCTWCTEHYCGILQQTTYTCVVKRNWCTLQHTKSSFITLYSLSSSDGSVCRCPVHANMCCVNSVCDTFLALNHHKFSSIWTWSILRIKITKRKSRKIRTH